MKKSTFLTFIVSMMLSFVTSMYTVEYTVVIPVSYDKEAHRWSVLLGFDNNIWTLFYRPMTTHTGKANIQAQNMFAAQTNNKYTVNIEGVPWKKIVKDSNTYFVHLVPVPYISGKELYQDARNRYRSDFLWTSADGLAQTGSFTHKSQRKTMNKLFFDIFKEVWAAKKDELHSPSDVDGSRSGIRNTWGASINGSWANYVGDTIYANKPDTRGPHGENFGKYYCFMNTYPDTNMPASADHGPAPIKLGLYYDKGIIGDPVHIWYHAESYYQAMKKVYNNGTYDRSALSLVLQWDVANQIMNIYNAYKGRIQGLRPDWQEMNLYIMIDLVRAKFMQNQNMKDILLATGNKYIVEETTDRSDRAKDSFFGNAAGKYVHPNWVPDPVKKPGMGSNILGQILMHVRKELRSGQRLDLTLYTEPIDFFKAEQGTPFTPTGSVWEYKVTASALQPQDIPLLVAQASPPPSTRDMTSLLKALNELHMRLNRLVLIF